MEYTHHFKVNSGASGNLLPLCLCRKIFPNVTQTELERSVDHRVQLLAYNKKVTKQLGLCYLHVKNSKGHTKLCKFFIVNSKFNPITGVNCALRLGLIAFKTPIFQNCQLCPTACQLIQLTEMLLVFQVVQSKMEVHSVAMFH